MRHIGRRGGSLVLAALLFLIAPSRSPSAPAWGFWRPACRSGRTAYGRHRGPTSSRSGRTSWIATAGSWRRTFRPTRSMPRRGTSSTRPGRREELVAHLPGPGRGAAPEGLHREAQVPVDKEKNSPPNRCRRSTTSASLACSSARAKCGSTPNGKHRGAYPRRRRAFGREGVHSAEVHRHRREWKSSSTAGCATRPTMGRRSNFRIDLTVQAATREVLDGRYAAHQRQGRERSPDGHPHRRDSDHDLAARFRPQQPPRTAHQGRCRRQPALQPRRAGGLRAGLGLQDLRRRAGRGSRPGEPPTA